MLGNLNKLAGKSFAGWIVALSLSGCAGAVRAPIDSGVDLGEQTGEAFVAAFYSWDASRLLRILGGEQSLVPAAELASVTYYQRWAQAGNYQIQDRQPCARVADGRIACAVTVTDDLGRAMNYVATDTFWLTVGPAADGVDQHGPRGPGTAALPAGQILGVTFTADDPPVFAAVMGWLQEQRPELFTGPCRDMFAGGTTPADCVRGIVRGAQDYMRTRQGPQPH